ncbi:MAG: NAD-dependent epimerase/dehydratase family protein [Flavobacteriales bacterium]|nr:NAD-dependent epimerase/dehydratase family protein [Flavobacteriales bacterium]
MILVTGGTGLLGAHVLHRLLEEGNQVCALHRSAKSLATVRDIFRHYADDPETLIKRIEWIRGDILDIPAMEEAMKGVSEVYHIAATVSFDPKDRDMMFKVNVEGTANVVNLCLANEGVRLCHVSSVAALGRTEGQCLIDENTPWKDSEWNSNYGRSKRKAEMEVWRGIAEGLDAVIVNPCIILGPGDWNQSSAALFTKVWNGLPYYTEGENAMVDVRDVAAVMVLLMQREVFGKRFIVTADNFKLVEVINLIADGMGKKRPTIKASAAMMAVAWRLEKLRSALTGAKPFITRETADNALHVSHYSNGRLLQAMPDFKFRPLDETVNDVSRFFLADMGRMAK